MEKLSRLEQETIINFNREESFAEVYTHEPSLIRKLDQLVNDFPELCTCEGVSGFGGHTYNVPKRLITVKRPLSDAAIEQRRERAKASGKLFMKKAAE